MLPPIDLEVGRALLGRVLPLLPVETTLRPRDGAGEPLLVDFEVEEVDDPPEVGPEVALEVLVVDDAELGGLGVGEVGVELVHVLEPVEVEVLPAPDLDADKVVPAWKTRLTNLGFKIGSYNRFFD